MKWTPLEIGGAWRIDPTRLGDARGFFARIACEETFRERGLEGHFVQMNMSHSAAEGTLRGLHFQRPPAAEAKLVRCTRGAICDVIVDLRRGSETYGKHAALTLDDETHAMAYVPPGCAHGFQTLRPDTQLLYFHSAAYSPAFEGGLDARDPALGITWPLPIAEMSTRDQGFACLADLEPIVL